MRASLFIVLVLGGSLCGCSVGEDGTDAGTSASMVPGLRFPAAVVDVLAFDIVQRTCALYTTVHSAAFEGPLAFGREVSDADLHWNYCPGGTLVACKVTPGPNGDMIVTGIPRAGL